MPTVRLGLARLGLLCSVAALLPLYQVGGRSGTTRLSPKPAFHTDWGLYASPRAATATYAGLRGNWLQWRARVVLVERRRDDLYILGRGEPSLVGAGDQGDQGWYLPIQDPVVAAFASRNDATRHTSAATGDTPRQHFPHFDMVLRVPKGAADSAVRILAADLWPGQHIHARGRLAAGPWPVLIDVSQLGSSPEAIEHSRLVAEGTMLLNRESEERVAEAKLRAAEVELWGAPQPLSWLQRLLGKRCDGDCVAGRGRLLLADGESYHGRWQDGKRHYRGLREWGDNTSYDGQYHHGLRHGIGVYTWPDRTRYEGGWKNHMRDGLGIHTFADGTRYEGSFLEGLMHGFGVYSSEIEGRKYEGGWQHDMPHGYGVETLAKDGGNSRYEGSWVDGVRHGRGVEMWLDGRRYEGQWVEDVQEGYGEMENVQGEAYKGHWRNGSFDGHGLYSYSDGSRYDGAWYSGQRSGQGVFKWPNGEQYNGTWHQHQRNGRGVYVWPDGRRFEGGYLNDRRSGHGFMTWPDGTRYEGEWAEDLPNGRGVFALPAGEVYDGAFKDGKMHGRGVMRWPKENHGNSGAFRATGSRVVGGFTPGIISTMAAAQGPVYDGEWLEDKRHGFGVMEWPDGRRYEGQWHNDSMIGQPQTLQSGQHDDL